MANAGIFILFHVKAGGKEVVGEEAKGLRVVPALVLHCFCYTLHLLTAQIEFEVEVAVCVTTAFTLALRLDVV